MRICAHPDCSTVLSRYNRDETCAAHASWEKPPLPVALDHELQAQVDEYKAEYVAALEEARQWRADFLRMHPPPACWRCTDPVEAEGVLHWPGELAFHRECYVEVVLERMCHGRAMAEEVAAGERGRSAG